MRRSFKIAIAAFLTLLPIALAAQIIQFTPESFTNFINSLTAATALNNSDQFYLRQNGTSKQVTFQTLSAAIQPVGSGGNVSTNGTITTGDCAQWASPTTIKSVSSPCNSGTVTSVTFTAPTGFAVSGSPITTAGTIALTLSGTLPNSSIPAPTASALGGVESVTCGSGLFINTIPTSGVPGCSTPAGGGNVSTSGGITSGNCAQWNSTTTLISTAGPCGSGGGSGSGYSDYINIKTYGAVGDGNCHPLSGIYGSLAAAQAVYPFVSDLTQCVDWAAIQKAINTSYSTATLTNGNFPVYCPVGNYQLSNPLILSTPTNGTGGSAAQWASGTTYAYQATVTYNGIPWVSAGSGNVGTAPTAYGSFPGGGGIVSGGDNPAWVTVATVEISNGSPAVITPLLAGGATNNVVANQPIVFFTTQYANPNGGATPALPTGINANQVYYVIGSSITGTTFEVSTTPGGSAVNTSSAGTGHFFANSQVWQVQPVQSGDNFNIQVSFIGAEGLPSNSGCQLQTVNNWTSPGVIVAPGNGVLIKNVGLTGQVTSSPGDNGYRCSVFNSLGGPGQGGTAVIGPVGWAIMSDGGGAHNTKFENVFTSGFYVNDWRSFGTVGELVDSNTWDKVTYVGGCINLYMGGTQAYVNEAYSSIMNQATTNVYGAIQEGVKIVGGNYSTFSGLGNSFSISSVSYISSCGNFFGCVQATIASPDTNLQQPMCGYTAGQANHVNAKWLNSWIFASGCGYNTFMINTAQWGVVGMYIADYNPFTGVILLGIPPAFAGIYENTCCGSNLASELTAATTLYATEAVVPFFGNNQVDSVHIENDGVPTTLSCFCTSFFGGARPAELNNVFLDSDATARASQLCCNQTANASLTAQFYGQQVIPYINSTIAGTVVDHLVGGATSPGDGNINPMDRVSIATIPAAYLEMRHTNGATFPNLPSTGDAGNPYNPVYDFMMSSINGSSFTGAAPLVNPSTLGQLSGGYYAMGGAGFGGGLWDNGSSLGPWSAFSTGTSGSQTDMANIWRMRGWGQAPQWGVRPAPWTNPCVLASQVTSLGSLPNITFVANLRDFLHVTAGGSGYAVNDTITLAGGTFSTAGVVKVTAVSSGAVTAVQLTNDGSYTVEPTSTFTQGSTSGGGSGATFSATGPIWFVNYTIGYPMLWGGAVYHVCDYKGGTGTAGSYAQMSTNTGYSYFQNLTTTNVPHLSWTMDGASPFIYMNYELLELMFPGLVFSLTGSGSCSGTQSFIVLEVHPTLGYVKTVRADNDGSAYVPSLASSGTTCSGTSIGQQAPNLINPY